MPKKRPHRPGVFVGSSFESVAVASAIHQNLDDCAEVTVWQDGVFNLSKTFVEGLIGALDRSDFGIFVFAPDDLLRLRKRKYSVPRDNVIFELGLFMGRLGRERTFIVSPRNRPNLRMPTDLTGIVIGRYDPARRDGNLAAALGPFCNQVRGHIRRRGVRVSPKNRVARLPSRKSDLAIVKAEYGIEGHRVDLTRLFNEAINGDRLYIKDVGNRLAGDPCFKMHKHTLVVYLFKGKMYSKIVKEGGTLDLPAASLRRSIRRKRSGS